MLSRKRLWSSVQLVAGTCRPCASCTRSGSAVDRSRITLNRWASIHSPRNCNI